MKKINVYEENDFSDLSMKRLLVHDSPYFKILTFNFKAGQELPIHSHDVEGQLNITVLEGEGEFLGENNAVLPAKTGDVLISDISEPHGIRAKGDMRVLVACEFSGVVRDVFAEMGHDAWSCDILPTESPGSHYQGDVLWILDHEWDLMIAHPPCTHLAVSGARWFKDKQKEQEEALDFVRALLNAPIEKIALENPVSVISTKIRKPDQIIQPWQFGHGETKKTCLWLKNLPPLKPTNIVEGREARVHKMPPSKDRWKKRSVTYPGIAQAMAEQWG